MSKVEQLRKEMLDIKQRLNSLARELDKDGFVLEVIFNPPQEFRTLSGEIDIEPQSFSLVARKTISE